MKAVFGVLSLIGVVAVVAWIAKSELHALAAQSPAAAPSAAASALPVPAQAGAEVTRALQESLDRQERAEH